MLCVIIKGPTVEDAHQQIQRAMSYADIVELRLDLFHKIDLAEIATLRDAYSLPMMFTLRSLSQGGKHESSEEERMVELRRLAALKPTYIDLECILPAAFISEITSQHPEVNVIVSYHDCINAPDSLELIYKQLQKHAAHLYKIAVKSENSMGMLNLLTLLKNADKRLIAISMGLCGIPSRILAPALGSPITYACLDSTQQTAPGQLAAQILAEVYRVHTLNPATSFYGLIGDPVETSISDVTHNALMGAFELNAVYVKMPVTTIEVPEFLAHIRALPFRGLSVTMPLKEAVMPYLDYIDPAAKKIGAVNTLMIDNGRITGYNTDGMGALNAIEAVMPIHGKRVVILGAGGAAKAIAYEACRRGADVTILNRDADKARALASKLSCKGAGLDYLSACFAEGYDLMINTTPVAMPIDPAYLLPEAVIMDIKTKPLMNPYLQHALDKGCRIIPGYKMFVEQAIGQFTLWFRDEVDVDAARRVLTEKALQVLEGSEAS